MSILEKEDERKNILTILKNTHKALQTEDAVLLREMSDRTVHSASIYKDPDSVAIAVTVYVLGKIIERKDYRENKQWPSFFNKITKDIDKAIQHLEKNEIKEFKTAMHDIRRSAAQLSGHLKSYIKDVFRKAQINKASRLYEHGISMAETAELLDITTWELAEYTGMTGISDVDLSITLPIKERINFTKKLFET
ncbi:MAG: hypothetical protein N3G19_02820 [Candidatus Pacearchaeota archaeon]|nr:hypothetical protein [Candidatus Pacearchaeota archaeon]